MQARNSQLPLELLQRIFLSLADLCYGQPHSSWGRPNWIEITYVCRYWRSAALNLRELWSFITTDFSREGTHVMIERSSPLPINITMPLEDPCIESRRGFRSIAASELLRVSSSRIRTLGLFGKPFVILNVLNLLCRPSLHESLILRVSSGDPLDLPEFLYGGDAPHLRRLAFSSDVDIRVPLWLLANITHFTDDVCYSLGHLLEMLVAMPQLEVLSIVRTFNTRSADPRVHLPLLPRTKLPRLSLLSISDSIPDSFSILSSCIDGPPTLRRHFIWHGGLYDDTWSSWAWLLTTLQPFVPGDSTLGASDGGLRIIQICGHNCDSFEMWSRTYSESASTVARDEALFLFQLKWPFKNPVDYCFPNPSLYFSSSSYIVDLTVAPEDAYTARESKAADALIIAERWTELLTNIPSVKTLRLDRGSYASVSVLRALSASEGSILPHLQRIIVINFSVHSGAPACTDGVDEAGDGHSVASRNFVQANMGPELMEAVDRRSGLEVVLAGCEVDEAMLDALRKRASVYIGYERVYV
jgi:hypothetical protein